MNNQAFIDGQNLHLSTTGARKSWKVDLERFRVYLREKYKVGKAYYFIGYYMESQYDLYKHIQEAGFILMFREHHEDMASIKKGNVDTDIVFSVMKSLVEREKFNRIVLVSGDGDYFRLIQYLAEKDKLEKILAPNRKSFSSLYKQFIDNKFFAFLDDGSTKKKIQHKKQGSKKAGSP
ncbi:NYN domain-containing protein [Candidatus Saccharibacteria bacterium]|nr:NYN domain-containing protein [Candidatus Saccharibacteria bacterium]